MSKRGVLIKPLRKEGLFKRKRKVFFHIFSNGGGGFDHGEMAWHEKEGPSRSPKKGKLQGGESQRNKSGFRNLVRIDRVEETTKPRGEVFEGKEKKKKLGKGDDFSGGKKTPGQVNQKQYKIRGGENRAATTARDLEKSRRGKDMKGSQNHEEKGEKRNSLHFLSRTNEELKEARNEEKTVLTGLQKIKREGRKRSPKNDLNSFERPVPVTKQIGYWFTVSIFR